MTSDTGILLFAHGSRDPQWRLPFESILAEVRRQNPGPSALAFLENMQPLFSQAADELAALGVKKIRVIPLFLAAGSHVRHDLPQLIQQVQARYPTIVFSVFPVIGESAFIQRAIVDMALGPNLEEIPLLTWYQNDVALAGQLAPDHVDLAKAQGFRAIICNRPDDEAGNYQTPHQEIKRRCDALGLSFHYFPVAPAQHSEAEARDMAALLANTPRPALIYCRTGTRSKRLLDQGTALASDYHPETFS
jgi:sirohydrochlorin cobaltochelatase